jgi:hypothetical protein
MQTIDQIKFMLARSTEASNSLHAKSTSTEIIVKLDPIGPCNRGWKQLDDDYN